MSEAISAIFIVRNEEHRIADAIRNVRPYVDEVVVVDQSSTDKTAAIALTLADQLIVDEARGFCEASRELALTRANGSWILLLDADEYLSAMTKRALRAAVAQPDVDVYEMRRLTLVDDTILENASHRRLFRKGSVVIRAELHDHLDPVRGARVVDMPGVAIIHEKTWAEQQLDTQRYDNILHSTR